MLACVCAMAACRRLSTGLAKLSPPAACMSVRCWWHVRVASVGGGAGAAGHPNSPT